MSVFIAIYVGSLQDHTVWILMAQHNNRTEYVDTDTIR